jgi:hypothetical protein
MGARRPARRRAAPQASGNAETRVTPPTRTHQHRSRPQRCATAHLLHLLLEELEIPSVPLHSHLTQPQRLESLARFRAREVPVLVTTDVGSRGLDIPQVAMVVNWDCPRRADDYVHRVGRTARAGRGGVAVTIVTERDVELVKSIEDEIKVTLQELALPEETVLENLNKVSVARRVATMVSIVVLGPMLDPLLTFLRRCTTLSLVNARPSTRQRPSSVRAATPCWIRILGCGCHRDCTKYVSPTLELTVCDPAAATCDRDLQRSLQF